MTTTNSKFAVTYEIDYTHRVVVGVTASDAEAAIKLASDAFDAGLIWDDTEEMPLLFDDFEEVEGETLVYSAEQVSEFPEPDASVKAIKQKEFAFKACQALLAGQVDDARNFASKAMPHIADALTSKVNSLAFQTEDSCLTSTEVIKLAIDHHLKLSLFAAGIRFMHYLSSDHDGQYFHESMDGIIHEIIPEDFLDTYPDSLGKIWCIHEKKEPCLTSTDVLELANEHDLKLSLSLKGRVGSTHFLSSVHDGDKYSYQESTGIDNVIYEISSEDFLDTYPDSLGKIWCIHEKMDLCLTSKAVLALARENDLKLHLILPGGHPSAHYLGGFHRDYYYLESMDGAIQEISSDDFLDTYPDSLGNVWLIIEKTSTAAKIPVLDIYSIVIEGSLEKMPVVE